MLFVSVVALLVLGPDRLPGMLRLTGQWIAKGRRLMVDVRHRSGVDEMLRVEGALGDMRTMMRVPGSSVAPAPDRPAPSEPFAADIGREYPVEGPDAYGALPDDLVRLAPSASPAGTKAFAEQDSDHWQTDGGG